MTRKKRRAIEGVLELPFKKKAFDTLQKALLESGTRIILNEPEWNSDCNRWTENQKIITEALCDIGNLYYESVPKIF